jgi:Arc/MetJ family transcription regulator
LKAYILSILTPILEESADALFQTLRVKPYELAETAVSDVVMTQALTPEVLERMKALDDPQVQQVLADFKANVQTAVQASSQILQTEVGNDFGDLLGVVANKLSGAVQSLVADIPGVGVVMAALKAGDAAVVAVEEGGGVVEGVIDAIQPIIALQNKVSAVTNAVKTTVSDATGQSDATASDATGQSDATVSNATGQSDAPEKATVSNATGQSDATGQSNATGQSDAPEKATVSGATVSGATVSNATGQSEATVSGAHQNAVPEKATVSNATGQSEATVSAVPPSAASHAAPIHAAPIHAAPIHAAPIHAAPIHAAPPSEATVSAASHAAPIHKHIGGSRKRHRIHKLSRRIERTLRRVQKKYGLKGKSDFLRRTLRRGTRTPQGSQ